MTISTEAGPGRPWRPQSAGPGRGLPLSGWVRVAWFSVWLAFLAYPVGDLVHHRIRGGEAALAWAGLALFVALYEALLLRHAWGARGRAGGSALPLIVAFTALTIALAFGFGANWIGAFIYLSVAYGAILPPKQGVAAIVANAGLTFVASVVERVGASNTAFFPFMALMIGLMMVAWRRTVILVTELREARAEVARLAISEERLRFARDLHDLLGHSLSLIVLKSELARRLSDRDPTAAAREVQEIEAVARQSLIEVREAVSGYRARGLAEELDQARAALAAAGIDPVVRVSAGPLAAGVEGVLGWAVREGVTNVVRHSGARRCEIEVLRRGDDVVVEVRDDGRGPGPSPQAGSGLPGLSERMALAGGSLETGPGADGGFRLVATLPPARTPA